MTKDDILLMAREAGFNWPEVYTTTTEERLERFAALVAAKAAAKENETCALICDEIFDNSETIEVLKASRKIRARQKIKEQSE